MTEIDEKGIAYSNNKIFLEACTRLDLKPDLVLSDGYLVKNLNIQNKAVIKVILNLRLLQQHLL